MANKHEINGYIYVTNDDEIILGDYYIDFTTNGLEIEHFGTKADWVLVGICDSKKIILCNNPNLTIQQLSAEEVEYLESVDSFEVEKIGYKKNGMIDESTSYNYKILIPKETEKERGITITNVSEQPKESNFTSRYQELFNYLHDLGVIALESELQEIERIVLEQHKKQ